MMYEEYKDVGNLQAKQPKLIEELAIVEKYVDELHDTIVQLRSQLSHLIKQSTCEEKAVSSKDTKDTQAKSQVMEGIFIISGKVRSAISEISVLRNELDV